MRLFIRFCFYLSLASSELFAQSSDPWSSSDYAHQLAKSIFKENRVIPGSPEAADLGKYGNIPVSLYTGTAQVAIPIYEIGGSKIKTPVSLQYSSNGFRPQDVATWVGLGWTLNAGGVITRSVMGNPDVSVNYFNAQYNYMDVPPTNDLFANYDYYDHYHSGLMESQPDVYAYNFNGMSGRFYIKNDANRTIVKRQKDNLKIEHTDVSNVNFTFKITDDNGNVYQFSDIEQTNMILDEDFRQGQNTIHTFDYASSWFLTSITSADGSEQIVFDYYTTTSYTQPFKNLEVNRSMTYEQKTAVPVGGGVASNGPPILVSNVAAEGPVVKYYRKFLRKISFKKNGIVVSYTDFISSLNERQDLLDVDYPQERLLKDIKTYSFGNLIKHAQFVYSYFTKNNSTNPSSKRLRLDEVKNIDVQGISVKPSYLFYYNGSNNTPNTNTKALDHWGYYNAAANLSLVPNYTLGMGMVIGMGADRSPAISGSIYGMLSKIVYPTGGYSTFEYEMNKATDETGNEFEVGGVRIKSITDYAGTNKIAQKKCYEYIAQNGKSSGYAREPSYLTTSTFHHFPEPIASRPDYPYDIYYNTLSASSSIPLSSMEGGHIGYTRVVERIVNPSNGVSTGYTEYLYRCEGFGVPNEAIGNGDLLSTKVFDYNSRLIKSIVSDYAYPTTGNSMSSYFVKSIPAQDNVSMLCRRVVGNSFTDEWGFVWDGLFNNGTCTLVRMQKTKYMRRGSNMVEQQKNITHQVITKYDPETNTYSTLERNYLYENPAYTYPTRISETVSNNEQIVTTFKYPLDYTIPNITNTDIPTDGIKNLQTKNCVSQPVETIQYREKTDGSNRIYLTGDIKIFDAFRPDVKEIWGVETELPLTSIQQSSVTMAGVFEYDPHYKRQGSFGYSLWGNIERQQKENDLVKSYIWDYQNMLPVAEAINAQPNMIAYTSFETSSTQQGGWTLTHSAGSTNAFTGTLGYNMTGAKTISKSNLAPLSAGVFYEVSYWSNGGSMNVVSNSGNSSLTTLETLNGFTCYRHRLPTGTTNITITSGNMVIDELRLCPSNAQMSSSVYKPGIGVISVMSPQNDIISYEYDGFNRLVMIKDRDGNIIKNYSYNYGIDNTLPSVPATLFYNAATQQVFTRNTACPPGAEPQAYIYKVPYGKYVSAVNQATADSKAADEITANGQNTANAQPCLYWNIEKTQKFWKNDCPPTAGMGNPVWYTVPVHTYASEMSQADADGKAQADINANGQSYANNTASCSCGAQGSLYINGTCYTNGQRVNISTSLLAAGGWECRYQYLFVINGDPYYSGVYTEINSSPCTIQ